MVFVFCSVFLMVIDVFFLLASPLDLMVALVSLCFLDSF